MTINIHFTNPDHVTVVMTANLILGKIYDLKVTKEDEGFSVGFESVDAGLDIIHKIQDLLVMHGFEKDYKATFFGNMCKDLIDIFYKYDLS